MKLTGKQESFARLVALKNYTFADAYRAAYEPRTGTDKTIWENASRVANDTKVSARISELRALSAEEDATYQALIKGFLVDTLEDEMMPTRTRLRASEILGRATGLFTQKLEVSNVNIDKDATLKELTTDELKWFMNWLRTEKFDTVDGETVARQVEDIIERYQ